MQPLASDCCRLLAAAMAHSCCCPFWYSMVDSCVSPRESCLVSLPISPLHTYHIATICLAPHLLCSLVEPPPPPRRYKASQPLLPSLLSSYYSRIPPAVAVYLPATLYSCLCVTLLLLWQRALECLTWSCGASCPCFFVFCFFSFPSYVHLVHDLQELRVCNNFQFSIVDDVTRCPLMVINSNEWMDGLTNTDTSVCFFTRYFFNNKTHWYHG